LAVISWSQMSEAATKKTKSTTGIDPLAETRSTLLGSSSAATGVVDGRDHKGVGDWLLARPLEWRLAAQVVAIDPSSSFRKALRMWLPRTAVAVDHFHLVPWPTTP
jgi:hypothetical protein